MLEWAEYARKGDAIAYAGTRANEIYAYIVTQKNGLAFYQFKGLQGAELNSGGFKSADSLETAKKICTAMMSAWKHELN